MKFKRLLITLLLISSFTFGGLIKPPEAVKDIWNVNSNLTPVYNFNTGKISMGTFSSSQLTNQIIGQNVKGLTSAAADLLYLRLDTTNNPLTGQLQTIDGTKTIPAIAPASNTDLGIYFSGNLMYLTFNDALRWEFSTSFLQSITTGGMALKQAASSATNPVYTFRGYTAYGLGGAPASGYISLIANSVEALRVYENTYDQVIISPDGVQNLPATPSQAFGDGDSGFYESIDDWLRCAIAGVNRWVLNASYLGGSYADNSVLTQGTVSATVPGLAVRSGDLDTGVGSGGADIFNCITGAISGLQLTELSNGAIPQWNTTAGITASTTQTQGQQPLISRISEISTVANPNDTVTLPSAIGGDDIIIINNGANTLQIFPASGDNAGAGVDTAITLASGSNLHLVSYNATNWEQI